MKGRPVLALVAAASVVVGCSSSPSRPRAALPPPPPVVTVEMEDFSLSYKSPVPAGRVIFRARNVGKVLHNLVVLPLEEDLPPLDEQLRGSERRVAEPFAAIRPVPPGQSREFAVELKPGQRYGMFCSVADAEGKSHATKGMNSEFRPSSGPAAGKKGERLDE